MSYSIQVGDRSLDVTYDTCSVSQYNLTCDVIRMTRTNTSLGYTNTSVTVADSMLCSIEWNRGTVSNKNSKETTKIDGILRCRKPCEILTSDKVYYNEKYYEIVYVLDVNNLGVLLEIGIKRES